MEMNAVMNPSRRIAANTRTIPVRTASVDAACRAAPTSPPGATCETAVAVRIAIVDVTLTLSTRELPRSA
jgi:hypothetical protein